MSLVQELYRQEAFGLISSREFDRRFDDAVERPLGSIDLDIEDALLDDLRAIENLVGKEFKPVMFRTW